MSKIGDCLGNKYELRKLLGSGGQAEVWQAIDTDLGRNVAIKILYPPWQVVTLRRFKREAMVLASLRHPNILQIYDFVTTPDTELEDIRAYMVMEYIEGQTLADYIKKTSYKGNFPSYRDIIYLFASIGSAIDSAHNSGIIHRDIKPANILLDMRYTSRNAMGKPVLTDFGLVKLQGAPLESATRLGLGTPAYIAPEQVEGRIATRSSDIYSLGVILYEIFTGRLPFRGETAMGLMMQHVEGVPIPPMQVNSTISPALNAVILHSMEKDPEKRFPGASAMVTALSEALHMPVAESLNLSSEAPQGTADLPIPSEQLMDEKYPSGMTTIEIPQSYQDIGLAAEGQSASKLPNEYLIEKVPTNPLPAGIALAKEKATLIPGLKTAKRRRRVSIRWTALLMIALLIVLIPVVLFVFSRSNSNASNIAGHAYFLSNTYPDDTFQINLQNIPDPIQGKSYYAWLASPTVLGKTTWLFAGQLTNEHGTWRATYTNTNANGCSSQKLTACNLLQFDNQVLITEEAVDGTPSVPTAPWLYYAQFSSTVSAGNIYSLWQHLQHLLFSDPELSSLKPALSGGLVNNLNGNVASLFKWALIAKDHSGSDPNGVRQQLVNMLYYLEGPCVSSDQALTINGTILQPDTNAIKSNNQISLLACANNPKPTMYSYIQHIVIHLASVANSPNATSEQRDLASKIMSDTNNLVPWLTEVKTDAVQLLIMLNQVLPTPQANQILQQPQAQALLQNLVLQAGYAFGGYADPVSGQTHPGVAVISGLIQQLATFDVVQCSSQSTCFSQ